MLMFKLCFLDPEFWDFGSYTRFKRACFELLAFWVPEFAVASCPLEFSMTYELVANYVKPSLREFMRLSCYSALELSRFETNRPEGRYYWIILLGCSYMSGIRFFILFVFLIYLLLLSEVFWALFPAIVILPLLAFSELWAWAKWLLGVNDENCWLAWNCPS